MRKFLKQYTPFYKNYILEIILGFIGILLVAGATAGTAYAIQPLLDDIFINKDEEMLYIMPVIIILLYFAKGLGTYLQAYFVSYMYLIYVSTICL